MCVKKFFEDLSCDAILNTDKFYGPDPELFVTSGDQCSVANAHFLWSGLYLNQRDTSVFHDYFIIVMIFARISSNISIYVFKSIMCQNDSDMPGEDISFLVVFFIWRLIFGVGRGWRLIFNNIIF